MYEYRIELNQRINFPALVVELKAALGPDMALAAGPGSGPDTVAVRVLFPGDEPSESLLHLAGDVVAAHDPDVLSVGQQQQAEEDALLRAYLDASQEAGTVKVQAGVNGVEAVDEVTPDMDVIVRILVRRLEPGG